MMDKNRSSLKATAPGIKASRRLFSDRVLDEARLAGWIPLQRYLDALSDLVRLDFLVMNPDRVCVCGTRSMKEWRGYRAQPSTTLAAALTLDEPLLVIKGNGDKCRQCKAGSGCRVQASLTSAIDPGHGQPLVVQIVACSRPARKALLEGGEQLLEGIGQILAMHKTPTCPDTSLQQEDAGDETGSLRYLIGDSEAVRILKQALIKAARSDAIVLIQGESGTGKELAATAVHEESGRKGKPFVAVNCGAISETLFESELFGYEKGAFSGADPAGKKGFLEAAHTGTLFLDEISEMPMGLQVKLLRFLQERTFYRVGGNTLHKVDVRVIAASNTCLSTLVAQGKFREDLYFRLNVIPLRIPPLRERKEDIVLLVGHFLEELSGAAEISVTRELIHAFEAYAWPGNIRELRNFVEYGVHFCENRVLTLDIMKSRFEQRTRPVIPAQSGESGGLASSAPPGKPHEPDRTEPVGRTAQPSRHIGEIQELERLLNHYGHSVSGKREAARHLGINLATLYRRLAHTDLTG